MRLTNNIEHLEAELDELTKAETPDATRLAALHLTLAVAFLRKQENAPAIAHLRDSLRYDDSQAIAHAYLGAALLEEYQVDEARSELEKAEELAPADMLVQLKLGEFNYKLGFYGQAVEHLEKAARLQAPNAATAQYLVALLEKARKHSRNMVVRNPQAPNFKKLNGWLGRLTTRRSSSAAPVATEGLEAH